MVIWPFCISHPKWAKNGPKWPKNDQKMPQKWKKHILVRYSGSDRSETLANKISWWSGLFGFHTQNWPKMRPKKTKNGPKMARNWKKVYHMYLFWVLQVWNTGKSNFTVIYALLEKWQKLTLFKKRRHLFSCFFWWKRAQQWPKRPKWP